ncbi:MAG TPA: energy-coupling factor transporter transmembrane component T, partial [Candidatus Saccharimonadia bacterium]|nr:energy-coupling factor transporter transmembrane component T [Candidatus Saccharimonadia bacterium]
LLVAFVYYRSASIPWAAVRRQWAFVLFFVTLLVFVNTLITGGVVPNYSGDYDVFFTMPLLGTPISAQSLAYAGTQLLRFVAMTMVGFPVAYAMAPDDFGIAFRRLGVPDKFAFAIDLTFRFLPSLANDMQTTVDAQRVRGHDWQDAKGGPIARLRNTMPVVVPSVINALVGAEDTIDAMDLRGFGTGKRTWLKHLVYDRADRLVIGYFLVQFLILTVLGFTTAISEIWVPQILIDLANR